MSHEVLHPKHWKAARGYANGVAATGRMVFTGGLIGWNADQQFESDDFVDQVAVVLRSIVEVLACAGAGLATIHTAARLLNRKRQPTPKPARRIARWRN